MSQMFYKGAGMASERLKFYQIYYRDEQLKECYDFATAYRNGPPTDFFENSIIEDLVPKTDADYISVCSWRLRRKRLDGWTPVILKFANMGDDLSEEKILKQDFDIAVLTPRSGSHKMLGMSEIWHGQAWRGAFNELKKFMLLPEEVKTPIYENHFIARKEIYHAYVNNCLSHCMEFMSGRDVFFQDSGYSEKKSRDKQGGGPQAVERYRQETGRKDWPIAPFILERLFSIWINDKDFKIINI